MRMASPLTHTQRNRRAGLLRAPGRQVRRRHLARRELRARGDADLHARPLPGARFAVACRVRNGSLNNEGVTATCARPLPAAQQRHDQVRQLGRRARDVRQRRHHDVRARVDRVRPAGDARQRRGGVGLQHEQLDRPDDAQRGLARRLPEDGPARRLHRRPLPALRRAAEPRVPPKGRDVALSWPGESAHTRCSFFPRSTVRAIPQDRKTLRHAQKSRLALFER